MLRVLEQHATYDNATPSQAQAAESNEVWRREDPKPDKVKRKKLLISVGVLAVATLLVVGWIAAGVIGMFTESNRDTGSSQIIGESGNNSPGSSEQQKPSAPPTPVTITGGTSFNTNGEPDAPQRIPFLFDGNPSTFWATFDYKQQLGPGGISNGTGAVLTFDHPSLVRQVVINSPSAGTKVEIRTVDGAPNMTTSKVIGSGTLNAGDTTIPVQTDSPAQQILVVVTQLSPHNGQFASQINEVKVLGSAG